MSNLYACKLKLLILFFSVDEKLYEAQVFEVKDDWKIRVETTKKIMQIGGDNKEFTEATVTRIKEDANGQVEEKVLKPKDTKTYKYDTEGMRAKALRFAREFLSLTKESIEVAKEGTSLAKDIASLNIGNDTNAA